METQQAGRGRPGLLLLVFNGLLVASFFAFFGLLGDAVPPDPNLPGPDGQRSIATLESELRQMWRVVEGRRARKRLTDEQADRIFREFARERASAIKIEQIPLDEAFRYGEIFRAARLWSAGRIVFRAAVNVAPNEDRRVNDTLRLAHCEAELGNVTEAVRLVRSTFDAPPGNKPPILLATYLEIVPALEGKAPGPDLAQLLRETMRQHQLAKVVEGSEPGRQFLLAREHHLRQAEALAKELETQK